MAVLFSKENGKWLLRANFGVTKRANSVWTSADMPEGDYQKEIEHFYKSLGLPVCIQISDASPEGLDDALADSGYEKIDECFQMTASCCDMLDRTFTTADLGAGVMSLWVDNFIQLEEFSQERHCGYTSNFKRMQPCKTFFTMYTKAA